MSSLFANYVHAIESFVKPWTPVGLGNALWDLACYDGRKLSLQELVEGLRTRPPMIEGAVVIVGPEKEEPPIEVRDLRKYPMEEALTGVDTIAVPGCATSAVGAIALGRTVAQAIGRRVAAIIAGYGRRDELGEIASGMVLSPWNWLLNAIDPVVRVAFGRGIPASLESRIFEVVAGMPEAATLHQLLLRSPAGAIRTIISHSKGNYAVAAALYALRCSLDEADQRVVDEKTDIDLVTFGCWTRLPSNFGRFRYHQYVGTFDILGFLNSPKWHLAQMWLQGKIRTERREYDEALVPWAMHNLLPWNPFHMPAEVILEDYAGPRQRPPLRRAA
jgi:hypothetical protein